MMELLPDLPGTITGIKCKNPFIVQCPTCGDCYTSRAMDHRGPFRAVLGLQ